MRSHDNKSYRVTAHAQIMSGHMITKVIVWPHMILKLARHFWNKKRSFHFEEEKWSPMITDHNPSSYKEASKLRCYRTLHLVFFELEMFRKLIFPCIRNYTFSWLYESIVLFKKWRHHFFVEKWRIHVLGKRWSHKATKLSYRRCVVQLLRFCGKALLVMSRITSLERGYDFPLHKRL